MKVWPLFLVLAIAEIAESYYDMPEQCYKYIENHSDETYEVASVNPGGITHNHYSVDGGEYRSYYLYEGQDIYVSSGDDLQIFEDDEYPCGSIIKIDYPYTPPASESCGQLTVCVLENLSKDNEIPIEGLTIYPVNGDRYTVRCDIDGDVDKVTFESQGNTHTERMEAWYMAGNWGDSVSDSDYLSVSCGDKTVQVVGSVDEGVCFSTTLELSASC